MKKHFEIHNVYMTQIINKVTRFCIVMGIMALTAVLCSCGHENISSNLISVTSISHDDLPKLDYSQTIGYATFEGTFCKVQYRDGAFSFLTFDGAQVWPKRVNSTQPAVCWNEVSVEQSNTKTDSASVGLTLSFGSKKTEETENAENKSSFEKAFIGTFCMPSTKKMRQIVQYPNEIAFSNDRKIPFSTTYDFSRDLSSAIPFHGRALRVAKPGKRILFKDAQTGEQINRSEYTAGRLHAVGILGKDDNELLVVIKTFASYNNESEIWIFDHTFKRIYFKKIHGRHWKLVKNMADPNTLFAYRHYCDVEIIDGIKISLKSEDANNDKAQKNDI